MTSPPEADSRMTSKGSQSSPSIAPTNGARLWLWLLALCALGLAARLPTLQSRSLWLDEAYSAWFSGLSLHELWTDVPKYESHPPMYYTLLMAWRGAFGSSEAALRSLSVFAGVLTIAVVASAGRVLKLGRKGDEIALTAALFLALNAGSVKYAEQARPYALETLAATIAILAAARLQRELLEAARGLASRPVPSAVVLALATGSTMWLHDTGVLVAYGIWAGLALSLLISTRSGHGRQALILVASGLGAIAVCAPLIPILAHQTSNMSRMHFWLRATPRDFLAAWYLVTGTGNLLLILQGLAIVSGLVVLWRRFRPEAIFVSTVLFLPLATTLAVTFLIRPIFIDRLFEWMTPLAMFVSATGIVLTVRSRAARGMAVLLLVGLGLKATSAFYRWSEEDWRAILGKISRERLPGDVVVTVPNELNVLVLYYTRPDAFPGTLYLPAPFPALGWDRDYVGNLGAPAIDPRDVATEHQALAHAGRVWLIERAAQGFDPRDTVRSEIASGRDLISRGTDQPFISYELYGAPNARLAKPAENR